MTSANSMSTNTKALLWAAIIIAAALVAAGLDLSANASFGLIAGLTGAAWGSVSSGSPHCVGGCLL
ncbi:MAG: hypothetical protein AAF559_04010 [Pseudomonadota bacterium]